MAPTFFGYVKCMVSNGGNGDSFFWKLKNILVGLTLIVTLIVMLVFVVQIRFVCIVFEKETKQFLQYAPKNV